MASALGCRVPVVGLLGESTMSRDFARRIRWHPHADEIDRDYSKEPTTLVVFELEEVPEGTRLSVVESGFEGLATDRLQTAFRGNEEGWTEQLENLHRHVGPAA